VLGPLARKSLVTSADAHRKPLYTTKSKNLDAQQPAGDQLDLPESFQHLANRDRRFHFRQRRTQTKSSVAGLHHVQEARLRYAECDGSG
jgi:hypothetical protein